MSEALLRVHDLHLQFKTQRGLLEALNGISFEVAAGEVFGLVGEHQFQGLGGQGAGADVARLRGHHLFHLFILDAAPLFQGPPQVAVGDDAL